MCASTRHVQDIKRKFNTVLDLGSGPGHLAKLLETETTQKVVMFDSSSMLIPPLVVVLNAQECVENLLHRDPDGRFEGTPVLLHYSRLSIRQ